MTIIARQRQAEHAPVSADVREVPAPALEPDHQDVTEVPEVAPEIDDTPEPYPRMAAAERFAAVVRGLPLEQDDLVVLVDALVEALDKSAPGYLVTALTAFITPETHWAARPA